MEQSFVFEIYTKNPETMEDGWEIKVGFVRNAADREDAERQIKERFGVLFDCVISCYECAICDLRCEQVTI